MGQSLVNNYIHIIFSTKNRETLIQPPHEAELHTYIARVCKNIDCNPVKVGGHVDHVHVLCMLSKNVTLVDLVKNIKANSSKWIKTRNASLSNFYWQDGYGAFSVNPSQVDKVVEYIEDQHEHHKTKTFQDEYRMFLKKYNVAYDERYVWD